MQSSASTNVTVAVTECETCIECGDRRDRDDMIQCLTCGEFMCSTPQVQHLCSCPVDITSSVLGLLGTEGQ
jgi:hypothetical protein